MMIGEVTIEEVFSALSGTEATLGRMVNPTVYSVQEFKKKLASGNHFLNVVVKGHKVFLCGDEDELRKAAGTGMATARTKQPKRN